jgi:hypothetical protein
MRGPDRIKSISQDIKRIGGIGTNEVNEATHLIAQKVSRTEKLLIALCKGLYLLQPSWLEESLKAGRFLGEPFLEPFQFLKVKCHIADEDNYLLKDTGSETQHGYNLRESLERARQGKMLQGRQVYVTPKCEPSAENLKRIVEAAGGKVCCLGSLCLLCFC